MKRAIVLALTTITASLAAVPAHADIYEDRTTRWRIQNYSGGGIEVYFTQAPCSSGRMFLTSNMSAASIDRFWSLLLTARATNKIMGVVYNRSGDQCIIDSFYLKEE